MCVLFETWLPILIVPIYSIDRLRQVKVDKDSLTKFLDKIDNNVSIALIIGGGAALVVGILDDVYEVFISN